MPLGTRSRPAHEAKWATGAEDQEKTGPTARSRLTSSKELAWIKANPHHNQIAMATTSSGKAAVTTGPATRATDMARLLGSRSAPGQPCGVLFGERERADADVGGAGRAVALIAIGT